VDTELDHHLPTAIVRDARAPRGAGTSPDLELRLPAAASVTPVPRAGGDDQVYAAVELVRRGLATRVVLVNAPIDVALPADWEVRGTPVHLEHTGDGRTVLTAGPAPQR
jgi:hypothetical protein